MIDLLQQIEAFLEEFEMSPTAFGIKALNDPGFVGGLRSGRDTKMSTAKRCFEYMQRMREEQAAAQGAAA